MSIMMKRSRSWMIVGAVIVLGAFLAWLIPNIAMSQETKKATKTKKAKRETPKGNKTETCLTKGCPNQARCVVMNEKPICVYGTKKSKPKKNRAVRQGRKDLKHKHAKDPAKRRRDHFGSRNPAPCMQKHCPPETRCQMMGGKAQCVPTGKTVKVRSPKGKVRRIKNKRAKAGRFGDQDAASCLTKQCPPNTECVMVGGYPQCLMDRGSRTTGTKSRYKAGYKYKYNRYKKRHGHTHRYMTPSNSSRVNPARANRDRVRFKPRKVMP